MSAARARLVPPDRRPGQAPLQDPNSSALTKPALMSVVAWALEPYTPVEIANAVGCTQRAAENWQARLNLVSADMMSRLRSWRPELDAELHRLEALERQRLDPDLARLRAHHGPGARLADGD